MFRALIDASVMGVPGCVSRLGVFAAIIALAACSDSHGPGRGGALGGEANQGDGGAARSGGSGNGGSGVGGVGGDSGDSGNGGRAGMTSSGGRSGTSGEGACSLPELEALPGLAA